MVSFQQSTQGEGGEGSPVLLCTLEVQLHSRRSFPWHTAHEYIAVQPTGMSEKRVSEGSADWRLTSLFRPISQLSLPRSNRTSNRSFQEAFAANFSLSIPSIFGRLGGITPQPDTVLLTANNDEESNYPDTDGLETSPSDCPSMFESANEEADEIRPLSGPQTAVIATVPQRPPRALYARSGSRSSTISRSTRRPESRDTEHLAELPALPPKFRETIRSNQATVFEHTTAKRLAERRETIPPPVPAKPQKPSVPPVDATPDLVSWDGPMDPENALNWSKSRKWTTTLALGFVTFCVTFASSCISPATKTAATEYGVALEVRSHKRDGDSAC